MDGIIELEQRQLRYTYLHISELIFVIIAL